MSESKDDEAITILDDLHEGEFNLMMKDDANEVLARTVTLAMPDALHIDLGPDQHLQNNTPITLDITAQIPDSIQVTYDWENSFGFSSSDSVVSLNESGIYTLTVTKRVDGCKFKDQIVISGSDKQRVAVFPTLFSTTDKYNVSVSLPEPGPVVIRIFNLQGVMMKTLEGTGNAEYQFVTKGDEPGVFAVVVQTINGIETRKIIVH